MNEIEKNFVDTVVKQFTDKVEKAFEKDLNKSLEDIQKEIQNKLENHKKEDTRKVSDLTVAELREIIRDEIFHFNMDKNLLPSIPPQYYQPILPSWKSNEVWCGLKTDKEIM